MSKKKRNRETGNNRGGITQTKAEGKKERKNEGRDKTR